MKFLMRYSLSINLLIYGILLEEGIYTPTRGTGNGVGFIIFGVLFLLLAFYLEYIETKEEIHTKEVKTILDYLCATIMVLGLIYFSLFLFEIVTNYFVFIIIVLSFIFCGKSARKFIY